MRKLITVLIMLLGLQLLTFTNAYAAYDPAEYSQNDVDVINAIIDRSGLIAAKDDPASWVFAEWNGNSPKRITTLYFYNKNLTDSLNVSGLSSLQELSCDNNSLTELNVSGLSSLQRLYCYNNSLTELNVSGLSSLQTLYCGNNSLTELNVSGLSSLQELNCDNNSLTELNVSGLSSLQRLYCYNNSLTELNVSGLSSLEGLYCSNNSLTELNVSGLSSLQNLNCSSNSLTELNVSGLSSLGVLYCNNNSLTELNVSGLSSLQTLYCNNNSLTELNVSGLSFLLELYCNDNSLTELNFSGLTSLKWIYCDRNNLSELNVSELSSLEQLVCFGNSLTALDVSGLSSLQGLECNFNPLTNLKLTDQNSYAINNNGANSKIQLTEFDFATRKVKLSLTPGNGSGFVFIHWLNQNGDVIVDNPYEFIIDSNIELTPVLKAKNIVANPAAKKASAVDITFSIDGDIKSYQYAVKIPGKKISWKKITKLTVAGISAKGGYEILLSEYKKPEPLLASYEIKPENISAPKAPSASVKSTSSGVYGTTNLTFSKVYDKFEYQLGQNIDSLADDSWDSCPVGEVKPMAKNVSAQQNDLVFIRAKLDEFLPSSLPTKGAKTLVSPEAPNVSVSFALGAKGINLTLSPGEGVNIKTLQYAVADKNATTDDLINTRLTKWKSVSKPEISNVKIEDGQAVFIRTKATSKIGFSAPLRIINED